MSLLSNLSIPELYRILDCKKLKNVYDVFNTYEEKYADFHRAPIINEVRERYQAMMVKFPVMHNLFSLIWNVPSLPIVALLAILQATALSVTTIIALTGGMVGLAAILGIYYFYRAYRSHQQSNVEDQKAFDFMFIKLTCAELILQKHHDQLNAAEASIANDNNIQEVIAPPLPLVKNFVYKNKDKNNKLQEAVLSGAMNSTMLVGTYLLVIATVCAGIGFIAASSAILGPIGLAVSCVIALAIGIFNAYTHYKSATATAMRDEYSNFHTKQLTSLTAKCNAIRPLYCQRRTVKRSASYNELFNTRQTRPQASPPTQRISFLSKQPIGTQQTSERESAAHHKI
jgi:cell fate (sporulation/competence/biofilm development) regulator YmcA (YheA/YmcA/DUF963 family)